MDIFHPEPPVSLRGDIDLWEEISLTFVDFDFTTVPESFKIRLQNTFDNLIQKAIKKNDDIVYFENHKSHGMSAGHISLSWWRTNILPELEARYLAHYQKL